MFIKKVLNSVNSRRFGDNLFLLFFFYQAILNQTSWQICSKDDRFQHILHALFITRGEFFVREQKGMV